MYFLNAPEIRDTQVFTRMPDRFRRVGERTEWAAANRGGQPTDSFLEGPVFDRDGNLFVTDIPFGRIFRIDPKGEWEQITQWAGEPNGMKFLNDRELLITDYRNGLMVCDVISGTVRPYLERRNSERFKGVNDLVFDSCGNLYFTDQGQTGLHDPTGRLYRLRPDGRLEVLLANVPSPNGVALSPEERVLYLAVTRGNQLWRVPLLDDGSVAKVSAFFTSYGPSGPDGLAVDETGRVIVANPGLGIVWVLNQRAEPQAVLRSCAGASLTNVAFGAIDRTTVYCTESVSGSILRATLEHAGLPIHRANASIKHVSHP